jgi:glycosyltransferase involved in cell wall biosynthesis
VAVGGLKASRAIGGSDMSRVDVLVPCYNYGRYLRQCVVSVLAQQGVDVRVLIIDDCSSDDSAEVGRRLAAEDPRVEFRRHEVNRGHIATYNEGLLEWAGGDYCMLLSADDMLTPGALARAARVMDAHPDVGFVHGRFVPIDMEQPARQPDTTAGTCAYRVTPGMTWIAQACRVCKNDIASPEVVVRTALQHELGGYRRELPHTGDFEMWLRLASRADVGILDADQAYYRRHASNMSLGLASTALKSLSHFWAAYETLFEYYLPPSPAVERLKRMAREAVATAALQTVYDLLRDGNPGDCQPLMELAVTVCPDARKWRLYSRSKWKLRLGPTLSNLARQIVGRRVATRA